MVTRAESFVRLNSNHIRVWRSLLWQISSSISHGQQTQGLFYLLKLLVGDRVCVYGEVCKIYRQSDGQQACSSSVEIELNCFLSFRDMYFEFDCKYDRMIVVLLGTHCRCRRKIQASNKLLIYSLVCRIILVRAIEVIYQYRCCRLMICE